VPIAETAAGAMEDRTVAFELAQDCRLCVTGIAKAVSEAGDTRVRQFLTDALGEAVEEYFRLTDIMVDKGWAQPRDVEQLLREEAMLAGQPNDETGRERGGAPAANPGGLAPHEALELHEIIRSEVVGTKRLKAGMALVQDNELRAFMQNTLQMKKDTLTDFKQFFAGQGQLH
jgi:hypothetical protein